MKEALKAFAEMVKSLPFLRYAYPIFAVILVLALIGSYNLETSKVFVAAILLIVVAFICYIFFSLLPTSNDSFLKWVRNIFAAFLTILASLMLTALASFALFQQPEALKKYFPKEEPTPVKEEPVQTKDEPVQAKEEVLTILPDSVTFFVRVDKKIDRSLIVVTGNVDGESALPDANGKVKLRFQRPVTEDTLAINFRNDKIDIIRRVVRNPFQDTFSLMSQVVPPPISVDISTGGKQFGNSDLTVETVTSGDPKADTDDQVDIELYGEFGSVKRRLNKNKRDDFGLRALNSFNVSYDSDIGKIKKAILRIKDIGPRGLSDWKIKSLTIRDKNRKIYYSAELNKWLGDTEPPKSDSLVIDRFNVYKTTTRTLSVRNLVLH